MKFIALAVLSFAGLASAQEEAPALVSDAPLATSALNAGVLLLPVIEPVQPAVIQRRYNLLLPILEAEALHFTLAAANNLVSREGFAQVSWDSVVAHFDGRVPWTFDVDSFVINQFGHPYQGSLAFTAARSSGVSFWWACIYPFMASLTWELFFEIDGPSFNDQITTPLGGIFQDQEQGVTMAAKKTKKNLLVNNINKRKKAGKSRPKSQSTVSKAAYAKMEAGWSGAPKSGEKKKSAARQKRRSNKPAS